MFRYKKNQQLGYNEFGLCFSTTYVKYVVDIQPNFNSCFTTKFLPIEVYIEILVRHGIMTDFFVYRTIMGNFSNIPQKRYVIETIYQIFRYYSRAIVLMK